MHGYEIDIEGFGSWTVYASSEAGALAHLAPQFKRSHRKITLRYTDPATGIRWRMLYVFKAVAGRLRPRRLAASGMIGTGARLAVPPAAAD